QKHIDIAISYQKSSNGLHLLVDSTGLKFLGEGEWKRKKHQPEYRRQWRKLHIGIDAETLQIRAVQLTTNNVSDSQVLGDLLDQIPQDEQIDSVYTDGAYDTKQCRQVIADRQAHAVIPPRKNAKPWKDTKISSLARNELLRTVKRLGRTFGRNGQAIIGEVWLKPRCIASNYWGINSVREIFKAKSMRFMHVWQY
ncbi:transposase DDE domain protein, partial [Acinetobacter baumannii 99063]